jgi:predicted TIM-barrel fold metal-dependent hydrolase
MKSHGKRKVMFGTNYPMITAETCMSQLDLLELDDEVKELFLYRNAQKVFGLS